MRTLLLSALVVLAFGCNREERSSNGDDAPATTTAGAEQPKHPVKGLRADEHDDEADIRDYMGSHFMIALFAHDRLVEGDLEALRTPLAEFAAYRYDDVAPGTWLPWLAQIQEAALVASKSRQIEPAATAIAAIARDCGACHRAHGTRPTPEAILSRYARRVVETVPDRMHRHAWAIDHMWQGLVFPSDDAWRSGAEAMASAPRELAPGETGDEDFMRRLDELQTLGTQAVGATTPSARTEAYAGLLARCASCHARAEVTRHE